MRRERARVMSEKEFATARFERYDIVTLMPTLSVDDEDTIRKICYVYVILRHDDIIMSRHAHASKRGMNARNHERSQECVTTA